jgi:isopenicillin N synthase-like dioxygenase
MIPQAPPCVTLSEHVGMISPPSTRCAAAVSPGPSRTVGCSVVSHAPFSGSPLPVIDIAALRDPTADAQARDRVARAIDHACRSVGFFSIVGHGVPGELQARLESASHAFFSRPDDEKRAIAMARAASAWRGWFPIGGELTAGFPDHKEGIYFGSEHPPDHPRVVSSIPLHGRNQFPDDGDDLRVAVLEWLDALRPVADAVMRGIALGLGLPATWFEQHLTNDPTVLFRIFHYPPDSSGTLADEQWGVGEHTDYGLLTLLAQDHLGGLQVRTVDGAWIDVEPTPGTLVCNLGDMLERLTGGRYRSTPHRVRNTSGASRLSFPYFFDPSWDATVPTLPLASPDDRDTHRRREDAGALAWHGTYGDYLTAKVAKVFPDLFAAVQPPR